LLSVIICYNNELNNLRENFRQPHIDTKMTTAMQRRRQGVSTFRIISQKKSKFIRLISNNDNDFIGYCSPEAK